ncbi:MAG: cellulase family glycosylhydrolase [Actinomycetota bacterium]|nr:cellulase family glycosylhydrolase [Actinomycetota bacterium]
MRILRPAPLAALSVSVLAASLIASVPAHAAPAPLQDLTGTTVQRTLFGMHVFNLQDGVWPTIPVGSIRLWDNQTTWSAVETAQDQFTWTKLDAAVATARANGVNDILMVLAGTPAWATDNPAAGGTAGVLPGAAGMPRILADWDDWVRQVATRYKGQITAYQPWNEANLTTFSTGTPEQMAELTKRAYDIIKGIDPSAIVVAPSTGTRLGGPFKKFYPAYLAAMKTRNWPVDVWAAHTYPHSLGTPADRATLAQAWIAMLATAGAPDLPLWDTENNFGLAGPGLANPDQDITDGRAATWTARTYLDALRLGISRVYWYAWGPENDLLGIQMNAGSPAAVAYSTLQDWIVGTAFQGCVGSVKVTCTFAKDRATSKIVWTEAGRSVVKTKGWNQVCYLDGSCKPITGKKIKVSAPVLLKK